MNLLIEVLDLESDGRPSGRLDDIDDVDDLSVISGVTLIQDTVVFAASRVIRSSSILKSAV